MTPKEIKRMLFDRDLTIGELADRFGCKREELSMCIHGHRVYPEIRKKLARTLKVPVKQLFPEGAGQDTKAA